MTHPKPPQAQKIETIEQLVEWLLATRPRSICIIAQHKKETEVSCVLVGADKKFATAIDLWRQFMMEAIEHPDPEVNGPPPRTERRRMERRR